MRRGNRHDHDWSTNVKTPEPELNTEDATGATGTGGEAGQPGTANARSAQLLSWRVADTSRKQARSREADAKARLRMLKGNEDATGATGAGKHEGRAVARHRDRSLN